MVEGPPIGKQRPRTGRHRHFYTPAKTVAYEAEVLAAFALANGEQPLPAAPTHVMVHCYFGKGLHPDPDNVQKLVLDALTRKKGRPYAQAPYALENDRHLSSGNTHQHDRQRPRIEVVLS